MSRTRTRRSLTVGALCALAVSGVLSPAQAAEKPRYAPEHDDFLSAFAATLFPLSGKADASPPGANTDPAKPCLPGADPTRHPRPVVLIHGTWENAYDNWNAMAPALANEGYCVYAINFGATGSPFNTFGFKATGRIEDSARELAVFVDRVLRTTGAAKVDLVGHSQGAGSMPIRYLKSHNGGTKVNRLVGINPATHGTTLNGLDKLAKVFSGAPAATLLGPVLAQQLTGSDFLAELNSTPDTTPGVRYTVLATQYDQVVTPYTSGYLTAPADDPKAVDNVLIQKVCPTDKSSHTDSSYSPNVINMTLDALDPAHRGSWQCRAVTPLVPLP
ncbi:alpha/beta fold hydrolase [Streptomyces sp. NBC_00237]|uniref:alpha/beta fold hydrolase n=1 Tax=Streptomyces sp. NBC_00237 TaxID=2975687 RepID=UPI002257559B|nr:alpha/beta fold hydrolase [Streptomyces sp. NBC_00237]MCX5205652.1 alpha/beta fold hydrolase [Streptomyces sp. NBC_00237]